jgi:type IV conjugative transfer system protein TraL
MSLQRHVILNYVDSPIKFLFWTKGELLMFFVPFVLGLFLHQTLLGIMMAMLNIWAMSKFKKQFGKGALQAVLYWYLPRPRVLKSLPASHIREYLG